MFLIVLDKNPYEAAMKIPDYYKHKQLLELMQMLSCVVNFGYKQLPQGKEIKQWIEKHPGWIFVFAKALLSRLKLAEETRVKYQCLLDLLWIIKCNKFLTVPNAETAIWRYKEEYSNYTGYESNIELPIMGAIKEYEKYMEWKRRDKTNN